MGGGEQEEEEASFRAALLSLIHKFIGDLVRCRAIKIRCPTIGSVRA